MTITLPKIIRVPKEIAETEFIKIFAHDSTVSHHTRWDYLARMIDPEFPDRKYPIFEVSQKEFDEWTNK